MSTLKHRLHWAALAVSYHIWFRLPFDWRIAWALLPYAGQYAHTADFAEFVEEQQTLQRLQKEGYFRQ